jgi:hypothetical protein
VDAPLITASANASTPRLSKSPLRLKWNEYRLIFHEAKRWLNAEKSMYQWGQQTLVSTHIHKKGEAIFAPPAAFSRKLKLAANSEIF